MFESEADLLQNINAHDELVRRCVRGELTFDQFCKEYDNCYFLLALDGHESDEEERELLEKYEERIAPHRTIAFEILGRVCSDADATSESYQRADRFSHREAVARLRKVKLAPR